MKNTTISVSIQSDLAGQSLYTKNVIDGREERWGDERGGIAISSLKMPT
jgi:hypothetical protein